MAKDLPAFHTPDFFERASNERNTFGGIAVPEFETAVILAEVKSDPGLLKKELADRIMGRLGRPQSEERVYLRYIDSMVSLGLLVRHDFAFHITPRGSQRLKSIRESLSGAMSLVYTAA